MVDEFRAIMADADADIIDAAGDTVLFDGVSTPGLFARGYVETLNVTGYRPTFSCRAADAPAGATRGSVIVYASHSYKVVDIQPDDLELMNLYILEG